jgi:hypothetical protein
VDENPHDIDPQGTVKELWHWMRESMSQSTTLRCVHSCPDGCRGPLIEIQGHLDLPFIAFNVLRELVLARTGLES